jgi:recombinational DNA repair protein (RecF pathway)
MIFGFEMKLLAELGLQPDVTHTHLGGRTATLLKELQHKDWPTISALKLDAAQQIELRHFLHGFLIYHLGRIPKGRDAALSSAG